MLGNMDEYNTYNKVEAYTSLDIVIVSEIPLMIMYKFSSNGYDIYGDKMTLTGNLRQIEECSIGLFRVRSGFKAIHLNKEMVVCFTLIIILCIHSYATYGQYSSRPALYIHAVWSESFTIHWSACKNRYSNLSVDNVASESSQELHCPYMACVKCRLWQDKG